MKLTISCAVIGLISVAGYLNIAQAETLTAQRSELVEIERLRRSAEEEEGDASKSEAPTCLDGWILNDTTCYFFNGLNKMWDEARNDCLARGSHLLEIDSQAQQDFIYSLPQVKAKSDIWIGLSDITTEGIFVLASSGNNPSFTNWDDDEPSNSDSGLDCVRMDIVNSAGGWRTTLCNFFFGYLCERPAEFPDP